MTDRDLDEPLLVDTKTALATPLAFSLPGWQSVQAALDFLKAEAKGEREPPLKNFLTKAGVVL